MGLDSGELLLRAEGVTREMARVAVARWFEHSQRRIYDAASGRSTGGPYGDAQRDRRGSLEGRQMNNLHHIAQSASVPTWDHGRQSYRFQYRHMAAKYHEWGTRPHEIRAAPGRVLAFKWPDAPQEVREQFNFDDPTEDNYQMVFFKKIDHPGNPAIGFLRHGRDMAASYLRTEGATDIRYEPDITPRDVDEQADPDRRGGPGGVPR